MGQATEILPIIALAVDLAAGAFELFTRWET